MKKYYYGLATIGNNECTKFICKHPEKIPINPKLLKEIECDPSEIENISKKLLHDYYIGKLEIKPEIKKEVNISNGSVVYYIDDRHHTALVLDYQPEQSKILLVTSNPYWNPHSRKITDEEQMFLGFPDRGKVSYFAPVIRPSSNLSTSKSEFPKHRINELQNEFKTFNPKY